MLERSENPTAGSVGLEMDFEGEDLESSWQRHYGLLQNHFSLEEISPPSWFLLRQIRDRWQRHSITPEAMIYRLRSSLEFIKARLPREAYFSFFSNPDQAGYGLGAVALTETRYGPFPYAFSFFPLSDLEAITGAPQAFLESKIKANLGSPTFFISPFFETREGVCLTIEAARDVLPPLKHEIVERNEGEIERILAFSSEANPVLKSLFPKYEALLEAPLLTWKNTELPFLASEEEAILLELVFWGNRANFLRSVRIKQFSETESLELQKVVIAGEKATAVLLIDYVPLIVSRARKYRLPFFTFSELAQQGAVGLLKYLKELTPKKISMFRANVDQAVSKAINEMIHSRGVGIGKSLRRNIRNFEGEEVFLTSLQRSLVERAMRAEDPLFLEDLDRGELLTIVDRDPVWVGVENEILKKSLNVALYSLSIEERLVVKEIFFSGRSLRDLAQSMGFRSPTSVWNIQERALAKLRDHPDLKDWIR